jgi:APA family basic amino acid/polyamine antiporter
MVASAAASAAVPQASRGSLSGAPAIASATIAAFFAFGGWWDLGRVSEEVHTPRRTMPRALIGGVLLVTIIYMAVTATFAAAAPADAASASDDAFVAAVGASLFGAAAGRLLAAMVAMAVAGSLAAVLFGAPRIYLAMARDGVVPLGARWFNHERGSSPAGTLVQSTLASLLVLVGSFDQVLGYFVPSAVFFVGLSAAALTRIDRAAADSSVFVTPVYPLPLVLFLLLIAAILTLFVVGQPVETLAGAAVVIAAVVVFRFRRPLPRPAAV